MALVALPRCHPLDHLYLLLAWMVVLLTWTEIPSIWSVFLSFLIQILTNPEGDAVVGEKMGASNVVAVVNAIVQRGGNWGWRDLLKCLPSVTRLQIFLLMSIHGGSMGRSQLRVHHILGGTINVAAWEVAQQGSMLRDVWKTLQCLLSLTKVSITIPGCCLHNLPTHNELHQKWYWESNLELFGYNQKLVDVSCELLLYIIYGSNLRLLMVE